MNPAPPRAALFAIDRGSETMRWPEGEIALPPLSIHKYSWIERRQCYLMLTRQLYSGYSKTKFFLYFALCQLEKQEQLQWCKLLCMIVIKSDTTKIGFQYIGGWLAHVSRIFSSFKFHSPGWQMAAVNIKQGKVSFNFQIWFSCFSGGGGYEAPGGREFIACYRLQGQISQCGEAVPQSLSFKMGSEPWTCGLWDFSGSRVFATCTHPLDPN